METVTPAPAPTDGGLWSTLKEAVRGSHRDFTSGSLPLSIVLLAVPMMLELVMESVFAVVDVFVVSRIGADAVATVGLTESLLVVVEAVAIGVSIGAMALVARRVGEKESERAASTAVQAIVLALVLAAPVMITGIALAPQLLALMGGSPWVLRNGLHYMQVMMASTVSITLLFLINAIFRGAGDAAVAMRVLWLANGINCVLAPCLVLGWPPPSGARPAWPTNSGACHDRTAASPSGGATCTSNGKPSSRCCACRGRRRSRCWSSW